MANLKNIALSIIGVILINYIITQVMNFLGINKSTYSSYLYWFMALVILAAILPKTTSSIFT